MINPTICEADWHEKVDELMTNHMDNPIERSK